MKASRKLGISGLMVALVTSGASAETRVYGAVANNYVFRGASWSDDDASVAAGLDWQHPSGIYAGGNLTSVVRGVETDMYAGFTQQFGAFALDFGATVYDYTDASYIDGTFREFYVGGQAGPVGLSVFRGESPFGGARYWYGQLDGGWPVGLFTIELHYGLSDYGSERRASDLYAGFTANWRGFDWRVRVTYGEENDDVKYVAAISKSWTVSR